MAALVGKYAANKLLKKQMKKYEHKKVDDGNDPYFAMIADPRHPGKLKKVKKQVPAYIPEHDAEILAAVRRRAYRLDCSLFSLFGIRFGWESVIGLIPAAGDAIGAILALMIVKKAMKIDGGLGTPLIIRMLVNIAVDFLVGLIPFVGDLADAAYKCNTMNLRLLEEHLDKKYKPDSLKPDGRDLAGIDKEQRKKNRKSGIYTPRDPPPATAFEEYSDSDEDHGMHARDGASSRIEEPRPTRAPEDRRGGERAGQFSDSRPGSRRERDMRP